MQAYYIEYKGAKDGYIYNDQIDARDVKSAKKKLERKRKQKIVISWVEVVGYY